MDRCLVAAGVNRGGDDYRVVAVRTRWVDRSVDDVDISDLRAQGVRLLLPNGEFERTLATRVYEADGGRWRPRPVSRGLTLAGLIAKGE